MTTNKKFKGVKVSGTTSSRKNSSSIISWLLNQDLDAQVELSEVYKRLKKDNYIVKPILRGLENKGFEVENIYNTLDDSSREQLKVEIILENFFKNLASTGSFCYFRAVEFYFTDELEEFFIIKGAQTNYIQFVKGKWDIGDKECPYYRK